MLLNTDPPVYMSSAINGQWSEIWRHVLPCTCVFLMPGSKETLRYCFCLCNLWKALGSSCFSSPALFLFSSLHQHIYTSFIVKGTGTKKHWCCLDLIWFLRVYSLILWSLKQWLPKHIIIMQLKCLGLSFCFVCFIKFNTKMCSKSKGPPRRLS